MTGPADARDGLADAGDEARRHQAGVEAARPDDDRVEAGDGLGRGRMNRRVRLQPDALDDPAVALPGVHLGLAARRRPVAIGGAERRALRAHRPHVAAAAEQPAQAVDGGEEVAAVLLHHRQQQVAAGMPGQAGVLERRQPRQQDAPRLGLVARQRQRALEHVARRQHAELVAEHAAAAAAVEHRDDGVQPQPRVALQAAQQAGQTGAAAEAADVELAELHVPGILSASVGRRRRVRWRRGARPAARSASDEPHGILWGVCASRPHERAPIEGASPRPRRRDRRRPRPVVHARRPGSGRRAGRTAAGGAAAIRMAGAVADRGDGRRRPRTGARRRLGRRRRRPRHHRRRRRRHAPAVRQRRPRPALPALARRRLAGAHRARRPLRAPRLVRRRRAHAARGRAADPGGARHAHDDVRPGGVAVVALAGLLLYGGVAWRFAGSGLFPGGDEPHYLVLAQSLWRDHDFKIENNHARGDTLEYFRLPLQPHYLERGRDGEIYSIHPVGLAIVAAPIYAAGGYYGVVAFLVCCAAGAAAGLWLAALRLTGSARAATLAWVGAAASAPFVFNSITVYPEIPAAACAMAAYLIATRRGGIGQRPGLAAACGTRAGPAALAEQQVRADDGRDRRARAGPPVAARWTRAEDVATRGHVRRRDRSSRSRSGSACRSRWALPMVVSVALWMAFFDWIWGSPFPSVVYGTQRPVRWEYFVKGGPGLLFDQEYGIVPAAPIFARVAGRAGRDALVGRTLAPRRRGDRRDLRRAADPGRRLPPVVRRIGRHRTAGDRGDPAARPADRLAGAPHRRRARSPPRR